MRISSSFEGRIRSLEFGEVEWACLQKARQIMENARALLIADGHEGEPLEEDLGSIECRLVELEQVNAI
jgi:hypothetical protein